MLKAAFRIGLLVTLTLAALQPAGAVPIVYTMSGGIQVSSGASNFNGCFTWVVNADTSGVTAGPATGTLQNPAMSSNITLPGTVSNYGLTNIVVYFNANNNAVTFGNSADGGGGVTIGGSKLGAWNFTSPVTQSPGSESQTKGTQPQNTVTGTDGTVITINGASGTGCSTPPSFTAAFPAPTITNVENAATNIPGFLPNGGIAQGGIFIASGSDLGPSTLTIAPNPFQSTSLSGTSISVTVGGTTVSPLMYYTSAGQIAALLPSNTPTGTGTISVTYNNQVSGTGPITVVANNLGIFTFDSTGQGPGIVTFPDYSLVSAAKVPGCGGPNTACGSANPEDTLILWATGLGPVNGSDSAGAGLGVDMPNIPLTLWLGGVKANVVYQGRSGCCIGEDQIAFTVPSNVPTGCAVPLLIQIGNEISNSTVMPVAATGSRNCTPTNPAFAAANVEQAIEAGPITVANLKLSRDFTSGGTSYQDDAQLQFLKVSSYTPGLQPFAVSFIDDQPPGTCLVYSNLNPSNNFPGNSGSADAGSSFTITGPNGNLAQPSGSSTLSATGTYLAPGAYTITGTGGTDIKAFNVAVTIPASPTLTLPVSNNGSTAPVTRSKDMTVAWTGGSPSGIANIQVTGATDNTFTNGATVVCEAPISAETFAIPSYALLALPAGNFGGITFQERTQEVSFTASGLSFGEVETNEAPVFIGFPLQ